MKARPTQNPGVVTLELNRRDEPLMAAATRAAVESPFTIKRILVPIDFSDCSKKALRYALPLAKQHQAALTLLHVVEPVYGVGELGVLETAELEAGLREGAEKELAKVAAEAEAAQVSSDSVVWVGSAASAIVAAAGELSADLIVISTHGRTGLKHVLLGSVAEHVVQRAPCPVFVVREREHDILAT